VRATSLLSEFPTIVTVLAVKPPDYSANRKLLKGRDAAKFNAKSIWSSVMDDLAMQR
jgi:hypothetical protein